MVVEQLVPGEKMLLDYFKERYLLLLNNDIHEEEERLDNVAQCMNEIDKNIRLVLLARDHSEALMLKENHMRAVVDMLQSNEANELLVTLAEERLESLSTEALLAKQNTESLAHALAANNVPLKKLLLQEVPSTLLQVIAANQAARECMDEFKGLKDSIALLNNLKSGVSHLDAYTKENNSWWVRFTNFLARFCSLFKSHAGKMIDKANLLKHDLTTCRKECEQEIAVHMDKIDKEPILGKDLLCDLPDRYQYADASDAVQGTFDPNKAIGLLSSVSMFNPKFKMGMAGAGIHSISNNSAEPEDIELEYGVISCH
jgi:hypothetical protein